MKKIITFLMLLICVVGNGQNWNQLGFDIDGEAVGDGSGHVSMNAAGDRVAIGASVNDGNGLSSGHVRIYEWSGTSWVQLGGDIDGEAAGDNFGFALSMNDVGDRVAIGASNNDGNGSNSGHVRIYKWDGVTWSQLGNDIDGEAAEDKFGHSVEINSIGDRVVIGAYLNEGNSSNPYANSGHVRIYKWSGTSWVQLGSDIDGVAEGDYTGFKVAIDSVGDRVAISSTRDDEIGYNAGKVRIYDWNGSSWNQIGNDIKGEAAEDQFGWSVAINSVGNRIGIGSANNDGNGSNSGHARIYEWSGTSWVQLGSDIDGEAAFDGFGWSLSINSNGDRVIVGAWLNDGNGSSAGHARIYDWNGTSWIQIGTDLDGEASYDLNGYSVSISAKGEEVAVGAIQNDGNGSDAGHVRIYQFFTPCINHLITDTNSIFISDSNFQNYSPQVSLISSDTFQTVGDCDSIVELYNLYTYLSSYCTDTLIVTQNDTIVTNITDTLIHNDTIITNITDTTMINDTVTVFDTSYVSISVTDTLYIDILITGVNNISNTIKVYPNPANDIVLIDNGNYSAMSNYTLRITNALAQQVFNASISIPQFQIPVSTLGSVGTYFIQILDGANNVVETKQLILH